MVFVGDKETGAEVYWIDGQGFMVESPVLPPEVRQQLLHFMNMHERRAGCWIEQGERCVFVQAVPLV